MTATLATSASTNREVTLNSQKVIFITGGVALLLVGTTLISVTGPAAIVQAFIQAGTAAAFTTGATGGAAAAANATPAVASALASGTLLVKQILLGATFTVSSILWLFYSCLFPEKDIDNENKDQDQESQLSWNLREFFMELLCRLGLRSRPSPGTPFDPFSSSIPNSQHPSPDSTLTLPFPSSPPGSYAEEDSLLPLDTTTDFITELLEEMGLGSYEDYNSCISSSSSSCSSPSFVASSSASISSKTSAVTVWYADGTSVTVDQNLTTVTAFYVDRPHPASPPPSSTSSSFASSGLRQRFTF